MDLDGSGFMGAKDGKVLGARMILWAKFVCSCHTPFTVKDFIERNPQMAALEDYIKDMHDFPWTFLKGDDS